MQPRVKQFLADGRVPNQVKKLILSPDVPMDIKEVLIQNPYQDSLINDFFCGRIR
ncbi:MAG: hypothetical protein IKL14_03510 [Alphaproteobacteria bacterium]|nr:hypothetical protein [Alphaproteobacteria bacterium]